MTRKITIEENSKAAEAVKQYMANKADFREKVTKGEAHATKQKFAAPLSHLVPQR